MQTNLISNLGIVPSVVGLAGTGPGAGALSANTPFADLLQNAIGSEQALEDQASSTVEGLMNGSGVDVHQAMIATQKANLAFEMALAVRNKAVAAYQQVMQMQF
jgi:flagellar hook-basal body complex protein FliE